MRLKPVRLYKRDCLYEVRGVWVAIVCLIRAHERHIIVGSDRRSAHKTADNDNSTCTRC